MDRYNRRGSKRHVVGIVIKEMSPEEREALRQLKSDDIRNIRTDYIDGDDVYYAGKEFSDMKKKFDKQLRR